MVASWRRSNFSDRYTESYQRIRVCTTSEWNGSAVGHSGCGSDLGKADSDFPQVFEDVVS